MRYEIYAVQMMSSISSGRRVDLARLEAVTQTSPPEGRFFAYSAVCWAWGYACRSAGRLADAAKAFEKMRQAGLRIGNSWTVSTATVDLGNVLRLRGQLYELIQVYRQGLDQFQNKTAFAPGFIGRLELLMAIPLIEQNDLAQARRLVEAALEHNRWWHNPNHDTHAWIALAMLSIAEGDLPGMRTALERAGEIVAQEPVVQLLRSQLEASRVQYWLASGQPDAADAWVREHASLAEVGTPDEPQVSGQLALARVWIAVGKTQPALSLLQKIEPFIRAAGRVSSWIEILALRALAQENSDLARFDLCQALSLGEPQGFARVFLDLGEPLRRRLAALKAQPCAGTPNPPTAAYVQFLLDGLPQIEAKSHLPVHSPPMLVEQLTARELEVLRCMAEGLTNPQIGARLYISTGTAKAHSAAIFRKLEVANRTEAVARAKDLHLL